MALNLTEINASKNEPNLEALPSGGESVSFESHLGREVISARGGVEHNITQTEITNGDDLTTLGKVGTERLSLETATEGGASLPWEPENGQDRIAKKVAPELEWPSASDPTLTNTVRRLIRILWAIVVSRALHLSFPLNSTVVSTFEDPTELDRKTVLSATSDASVAQVLAFWDSLEPDLQNWLKTLNKTDRITFITKLSLQINWR